MFTRNYRLLTAIEMSSRALTFYERPTKEETPKTGKVDLKQRRRKAHEAQWKTERRK